MSDRALSRLLRAIASTSFVLVSVGVAPAISSSQFTSDLLSGVLGVVVFSVLVWVIAPAQPRHAMTWILVLVPLTLAVFPLGQGLIASLWPEVSLPLGSDVVPSDVPPGVALITGISNGISTVGFFLLLTFGLLLFPDGHLPTRRWRWLAFVAGGGIVLTAVSQIFIWRPNQEVLIDWEAGLGVAISLFVWLVPLSCLVSLIVRYRRADAETKSQVKWIVWGGIMFVVSAIVGIMQGSSPLIAVGFVALGTAYGVAITKYRLYDIDVVVSRTFVYASLAIFIGAVYVGIVVGASALFGSRDESNAWLSIGATVVIAILFQPFRRRMERVANRMVYGRRSTPYEVLSSFSQNVAAVDPDVLEQVARSLTEGTTATGASILVVRGDELHLIATWPEGSTAGGDIGADITHDGERLGAIQLTVPTGQAFLPTDQGLVDQVSSGLGLALRNLQLTDDLRTRVDELRESRRRIVSVQDQTRQKLERDLHDGAQQRLVALKIKIGIGESMAQAAGLDDVADVLTTVKGEADMTIDSLRTLARGIYPPLLEAEGLGPALTTQLHRQPIPVTVQAAGVGRHPREIEATVYFCVLEAVQNSIRHAQAQSVLVTVAGSDGLLNFEVRDDGIGFDSEKVTKGPGLVNLTDRLDAVEGSLDIESVPGHGTSVRGSVPVGRMEQV